MICPESFYLVILLYFVLTKIFLFIAIRWGGGDAVKVLVSDGLVSMFMLVNLPWFFSLTSGVCT